MNYSDLPSEVMPSFSKLSPEKQELVYRKWSGKKKSTTVALVLALLGLSLLYFGKIWMFIFFLVTGGGAMVWFVYEVFAARGRAKAANLESARNIVLGTA